MPESYKRYTYAYIPLDFLRGVFGAYGMELPAQLTKPDFSEILANDTGMPSNIDPSTISYVGELSSVSHTLRP